MKVYRQTPKLDQLKYPVLISPKLDGIRASLYNGKAYSYNNKLIPNRFIQSELRHLHLPELDGELMVNGDFNSVQSAVMSYDGEPDFTFNVFDIIMPTRLAFKRRLDILERIIGATSSRIKLVPQTLVESPEAASELWNEYIAKGYEGAVTKHPDSYYKHGRTTLRENTSFKLKVMEDDEGIVTSYNELMHNEDTSSKMQENLVPGDCLGSLEIKWRGVYFDLGSGFTMSERRRLWADKDSLLGRKVTFKYQGVGPKGKPRFPVFKAFRAD